MKYFLSTFVIFGLITVHLADASGFQLTCSGTGSMLGNTDNRSSPEIGGGATRQKNRVKGPADLAIYYINSPGVSCGGLKTAQCSSSCGALGYPVYWCYPKVCYCHYGNSGQEDNGLDYEVPE